MRLLNTLLVRNVGKKCHLASSLDSYGELSLVKSAVAGYTSGENLCSLRCELSKLSDILVIDLGNLILAEDANLLSSVSLTECRTIVVFHEFYHLSDSRFLYYTHRSEPSGRRTSYPIRREGSRRREFLRNQHCLCCCKRGHRMPKEYSSVRLSHCCSGRMRRVLRS